MLDTVSLVNYLVARCEEIEEWLEVGWVSIPGGIDVPGGISTNKAFVLGQQEVYRSLLGELAAGNFKATDISDYII